MKKILSILFLLVSFAARSQSVVPLRTDTVKIYKVGGSAELVLKNATKDTTGFLYNTGNGVTKFLRGLRKINDSTYLIGPDTLKIHAAATGSVYTAVGYSITVSGDTLKLINDLASPGNSKYYGTNSIGIKSWLPFDYDSLLHKPTIPAQFNPAVGLFLAQSGSYPNITTRVDTGSASAYYLRRKDSTAGGYYPYSSNPLGYITSIDTGGISNFSVKVRSLFSVTAPLIYNSATGQYSLDTASGKQRSENYYNTKFASSVGNLSPLFTSSLSAGTVSYSLSNASGFTLFGRGTGSGAPSYLASIDSNWVPALHTEAYYNTKYAPIGGGGGGSTNTGVGSGYQVAINGTNNIKSLKAGTDITLDSATSNEVKIHADTASGTTKLATQGYVARNTPGLDAVTAVKDSTTTRMVTQDTIKSSFGYNHGKFVIGDSLRSDKVAVFFGHSVVQGVGVSNYWETYPWKTSELFGWKMYNRGIAGTTLRHHSAGDSCMIDRLPLIPTYSSTYAALFFNYDINDANTSSYTLDTTGYKTDYARVIDTAKARGWPDNKIILLSANWVDTTYPSVYPKIRDYVTATLNIARTKNVVGIDLFRPTELGGAGVIIPDGDHPNTVGTDLISGVIAKNYPYSKRVGILETTTLLVKDSARITNTLRLGTDTASLDGDTPRLIVSGNQTTGKAYIAGPLYIGTKAYPVPGVVSWINVFPGSSGQPGLTVKDATGYYAQVGADGFASTSYGSTSRYRGIGITMDASNGFNFTGGGGFTYFYLNNDHSVFGNNVSITDLDSNLKVKGGFQVTGGFRHSGVPTGITDTTTYKPYGINSSGQTVRMSYWPGSGGGGGPVDTSSISNFSVKVRSLFSVTAPLIYNSATGQFSLDTASGKQRSENYYNTKFASAVGNLSPLFTSSLSAGTISYSLTNASGFTLFGRGSGSGAPSYLASIDSNWVPALHTEAYYNTKYFTAIDTGNISNFSVKVRSLHTVVAPLIYNSSTGQFSLDTASGKQRSENYYNTKFASAVGNLSPLFTSSLSAGTISYSLTNASGFTLFGRGSGSGAPSYLASIDSNWVPALHTEAYYNTKYAPIGGGGGGEVNTASNLGTGYGWYASKSGVDLRFKSLTTGVGIVAISNTNDIQVQINGYQLWQADTVSTSNATTTTISTITLPGTGFMVYGTAEIIMTAGNTTKGLMGKKIIHFMCNSGTASVLDIIDDGADYLQGFTTATWTVTASGSTLLVRATGEAATSIEWVPLSKVKWTKYAL